VNVVDCWLKMSDPALDEQERLLDVVASDHSHQRILQLKKQRRRAIRRALSLERCVRQIMQSAKSGTVDDVTAAFAEAQRILRIPIHNALNSVEEPEDVVS
jgi:hypothetical protein